MPIANAVFDGIDIPRARALSLACLRFTQGEIATELSVSTASIRRWMAELESLTASGSLGELCRWRVARRGEWLSYAGDMADVGSPGQNKEAR
ncbi:MAG: hypothetical protein IT304_05185 [Dehalococcoidia bacterium]|nr:hypothetical protein [Dehalococcoidia bacterium]